MVKGVLAILLIVGLTSNLNLATDTRVEVAKFIERVEQAKEQEQAEQVQVQEVILTDREEELLLKVAQSEATSQGPDGMWLVMSVVLNRVESKNFPNTIEEVIYQKNQFSVVDDGRIDRVAITDDAREALGRVKNGEVAYGIIAFESVDSSVHSKYFMEAFSYRDHKFYTEKDGLEE